MKRIAGAVLFYSFGEIMIVDKGTDRRGVAKTLGKAAKEKALKVIHTNEAILTSKIHKAQQWMRKS